MRRSPRTLTALAVLAVGVGLLAACGASKPRTEVLGVQYNRPEVTTTAPGASSPATGGSATAATPTTAAASAPTAPGSPAPSKAAKSSSSAAPAAPAPGSIAGHLLSAGQPVSGAAVTVSTAAGPVAHSTTGADGSFRIDSLAPGTYHVLVSDPGDDTAVCDSGGGCVTKRPPSEQSANVTVTSGAVATANFTA